ncbi:hypothetical protein KR093_007007, partial [Drosophila rubida]
MLSVQTAGCAGMERLGVPTRTSLSTPPDDRDQFRCRMRVDAIQARELLAVRSETVILSNCSSSSNNQQHQQQQQQQQQHHNNKQQHSHHHQQQQQLYLNQQQQQQQQQRMTTPPPPAYHSSLPLGSATNYNNNINSNTNTQHSINNYSGSNVAARGGIEATTLKYGNTGSGSYHNNKGDPSNSSCTSTSMSMSSCGSLSSHSNDHHQHYQYQLQQQQTPRCPHHVPLPDSEYGQDRHLQIRSSYQQSEITRSYTKPPPNKTVRDVPEQLCAANSNYHRLSTANTCATLAAGVATSSTYALAITHGQAATTAAAAAAAAAAATSSATTKSKPNAITKFFSRISSPKSPTSLATSTGAQVVAPVSGAAGSSLASSASMSSSASSLASSAGMPACVSASSSASSLAAAPLTALPISNAATLKSTACSYGS